MLDAFIIGETTELLDYVHHACNSDPDLNIYRELHSYPNRHQLVRLLNSFSPKVVFLEIEPTGVALELARDILVVSPQISLIGFAKKLAFEQLQDASAAGIPEVLQGEFTRDALQRALVRAVQADRSRKGHATVAFLPAKGGSGATTVAMNFGGLVSKRCGKSVLLMEADLYSGALSVFLDLAAQYSIAEALAMSQSLDDEKWSQLVFASQGMDILPTPRDGKIGAFTAWDCQRVMSFASVRYDCVVVDLTDVISDLTEPVVGRADQIFVVTTPEMASLFLARRRLLELQTLGAPPEKLSVVLNRHTSRDVPVADVENYLETPIGLTLTDDTVGVREATIRNALVSERSAMGRGLSTFATQIAGDESTGNRETSPSLVRNVLGVFDRRLGKVHT